jgi:hypothetical protein
VRHRRDLARGPSAPVPLTQYVSCAAAAIRVAARPSSWRARKGTSRQCAGSRRWLCAGVSFCAAVLTEIHLCHACSGHEIEEWKRPGQPHVDLRHSDHDGTSPFFAAVHGKHAEIVVHLRNVCGVDEERVTENPFRHCSRNHVRRAHKEHAIKLEAQHQRDARCEQAMRQIMGPTRAYAAASARGQRDVRRLPCARPLHTAAAAAAPTLATCSLLCLPACLPAACRSVPAMRGHPSDAFFWGEGALVLLTSSAAVARVCARAGRQGRAAAGGAAQADRQLRRGRWTAAWRCRCGAVPGRGGGALAELGRVG